MQDFQTLLVGREADVLTVTLDRPAALNAINQRLMGELGEVFAEYVPREQGLRGVIIGGAGDKSFAAGADIKEFLELSGEQGRAMAAEGQRVFDSIERCTVPVVAVIQGYALGAGCELAMACHLRVAGERARFGQPEVNLGLLPGYGGTQRLTRLIGRTKALEYLMTAELIDAETALRMGLVNHVVPQGEESAKARQLLDTIGSKAPRAISEVIRSVNAFADPKEDGYAEEVDGFGRLCGTADFKEGAAAFVEKRKATFTGR